MTISREIWPPPLLQTDIKYAVPLIKETLPPLESKECLTINVFDRFGIGRCESKGIQVKFNT